MRNGKWQVAKPYEIYAAPRSWTEKAYPKLIYYNRLPKGGRFACWEQPELLFKNFARRSDRCARRTRKKADNAVT